MDKDMEGWLVFSSSRELGIEGSCSFLCLFIISISQRCQKTPKNSKNSIGIPHPPGPLSSPGSLVFPRVPLCFPARLFVHLLHCQSVSRFCPKVETRQCPRAKVFCRLFRCFAKLLASRLTAHV